MPTFAINFSRPGAQIVAQYYNFVRLGREGYTNVHESCREVAGMLADGFEKTGRFEALTRGDELPVIALKLKDEVTTYTVFDVSHELRARGWQVPAYTFPEDLEDLAVLRVVVRNGMTADLAELLLDDLKRVVESLEQFGGRPPEGQHADGFRH
jgi:glutamate decarboxylase